MLTYLKFRVKIQGTDVHLVFIGIEIIFKATRIEESTRGNHK